MKAATCYKMDKNFKEAYFCRASECFVKAGSKFDAESALVKAYSCYSKCSMNNDLFMGKVSLLGWHMYYGSFF